MGGRRVKKIRKYCPFVITVLLFSQVTIGFEQQTFASMEKSSVGITFEGNISPSNLENQTHTTNQELQSDQGQESYPATNERNNPSMITTGWLLIIGSLVCLSWMNKKGRQQNEKNSFSSRFI